MNSRILAIALGFAFLQRADAILTPPVQVLQPPVNIEVGEQALNTLLNHAFRQPYTLGTGSTAVGITIRGMAVDVEEGSLQIRFKAEVRYDLLGTPKLYRLNYAKTIPVASVSLTYSSVKKRVVLLLSDFNASLDPLLPTYVKTTLADEFGQFMVYPHEVMKDLGGPVQAGTSLLQKSFSIAFRNDFTVSFSLEKDLISFSVAPKWEIEQLAFSIWAVGQGAYGNTGKFLFDSNIPLQVSGIWIGDLAGNYDTYGNVVTLQPVTSYNGFPRYYNSLWLSGAGNVNPKNRAIIFRADENNRLTHFHTSIKYDGLNSSWQKFESDEGTLQLK